MEFRWRELSGSGKRTHRRLVLGSVDRFPDAAGNFYGTTELGGDHSYKLLGTSLGCGTVFKLDPAGQETVLYRFTGEKDRGFPEAGLVMDALGNLYGTASLGGNLACDNNGQGCGLVFEITPRSAESSDTSARHHAALRAVELAGLYHSTH